MAVVHGISQQCKNYLSYSVANVIKNAASSIRKIAIDLKIPVFVAYPGLSSDSDWDFLSQTRFGLFQAENQLLQSFIVKTVAFPLSIYA